MIGRLELRMPVATKIAPAPVVGKDEHDVGLFGGIQLPREQKAGDHEHHG